MKSILPTLIYLALVILGATPRLSAQTPHTPKPGSPERQAICDRGARAPSPVVGGAPAANSTNSADRWHYIKAAHLLRLSREGAGQNRRGRLCSPNAESPPQPLVFKIDTLRVQGDFAHLECLPLFSDGTDAVPSYRRPGVFCAVGVVPPQGSIAEPPGWLCSGTPQHFGHRAQTGELSPHPSYEMSVVLPKNSSKKLITVGTTFGRMTDVAGGWVPRHKTRSKHS